MSEYALADGAELWLSVDDGPWHIVTFKAADLGDIAKATPEEVAAVLDRAPDVEASVDDDRVVLTATSRGAHASLEVKLPESTAAAALGLAGPAPRAEGAGLQAARLVSLKAEPFALTKDARMAIVVDGRRRNVAFDKGVTHGRASADDVARVINGKSKRIARPTRDGRVALTSPSIGPDSSLTVEPPPEKGAKDAGEILGFVGAAAVSQPYVAEAPALVLTAGAPGLQLGNLTVSPIELLLSEGPVVVPGGGTVTLSPTETAHEQLQALIRQGAVRLLPGEERA